MQTENRFLIETSKLPINKKNLESFNLLDLDWHYILEQSSIHSTLPLLYKHIEGFNNVPSHVKELLHSQYLLKKMQGEIKTQEFKGVLETLHEEGVKAVVLKGVYLATNVYHDVALRPFGDMDILVDPQDTKKVFNILRNLGYIQGELDKQTGKLIPFSQERLEGYENELQHYGEFIKLPSSSIIKAFFIDVHRRLSTSFDRYSYNIQEVISKAKFDDLDNIPMYRLNNEDFLTHLCSHLYWHTQSLRDILDGEDAKLLAYSDIRSFIHTHDIDWNALFGQAEKTNLTTALYYTLYHCQLIYGDVIPHEVYECWDKEYMNDISNSIYDRWITRDTEIKIGDWNQPFLTRLFNLDRGSIALKSFYEDYLEPILHRGAILKVVELGDPNR
jgi:hypothetical protein